MSTQTNFATAYSFPIATDETTAVLKLGRVRCRVHVTHFSWSGYSVTVPKKSARRFKSGQAGRLFHQGSSHLVSFGRVIGTDKGDVLIELARRDDSRVPVASGATYTAKSTSRHLGQKDSVLSLATWLCLLLLVLASPGWGDSWGTSQYFENGIRTIGITLGEILQALRVR